MARDRKRPAPDWPLGFLLVAAVLLVPAALLGLALALDVISGPRWALPYAVLAIGGWISLTIVGMMLKICRSSPGMPRTVTSRAARACHRSRSSAGRRRRPWRS